MKRPKGVVTKLVKRPEMLIIVEFGWCTSYFDIAWFIFLVRMVQLFSPYSFFQHIGERSWQLVSEWISACLDFFFYNENWLGTFSKTQFCMNAVKLCPGKTASRKDHWSDEQWGLSDAISLSQLTLPVVHFVSHRLVSGEELKTDLKLVPVFV